MNKSLIIVFQKHILAEKTVENKISMPMDGTKMIFGVLKVIKRELGLITSDISKS